MWRILAAMPEKKALMIGVGGSVIVTTCKLPRLPLFPVNVYSFPGYIFLILTYL